MSSSKPEPKTEPKDQDAFMDDKEDVKIFESFDDMPLHANLLRGIYAYGFEKPSQIQKRAIVPFIKKGDIIAQAQSGTGKTGAFSIGLLARIDFKESFIQGVVLSPTRELAQQTNEVIRQIGEYLSEGNASFCQTFVGGTRVQDDIAKLRQRVLVVVGTPGRIVDLIKKTALVVSRAKCLVIDEADEMLTQGFSEQVSDIFKSLPKDIQVALFSATMPEVVLDMTKKFMRFPTEILVKKESLTLEGIKQFYVGVEEEHKIATLSDLYEQVSVAQSVIFANTRKKVDYISDELNKAGHTVSTMHAEMPKGDREKVMKTFREGTSRVLVTTDVFARGIDIHHVNIVINYDLPPNVEIYLHRIGRGGRYGRKGVAINFVSSNDFNLLQQIQAHYGTQIEELPFDFNSYLGE